MEKLMKVTMKELISYSKQKEVPTVTIIDNLNIEQLNYVYKIAYRLNLVVILVKKSSQVAIIGNFRVAIKIAKDFKKKSQVMYYDFAKRPLGSITIYALTGYTKNWVIIRDNGYIIKAYDENGEETKAWINTDIKDINPKNLNKLNLSIYEVSVSLKGGSYRVDTEILEHSRKNFIEDGIFNEERNCYYPKDTTTNKGIAEYNKLEKLFKKFGFESLWYII
jgi:hypothetical protein